MMNSNPLPEKLPVLNVRIEFTNPKKNSETYEVVEWKILPIGAILLLAERTSLDAPNRSKKGDKIFAPGTWHSVEVLGMV